MTLQSQTTDERPVTPLEEVLIDFVVHATAIERAGQADFPVVTMRRLEQTLLSRRPIRKIDMECAVAAIKRLASQTDLTTEHADFLSGITNRLLCHVAPIKGQHT